MDIFSALADPTRRQIIEQLALRERTSGEIAERFEMSRPAVSQHLKVLRETNIVSSRPDAQKRVYALNQHAFDELDEWVRSVRGFWLAALDELESALTEASAKEKEK